MFVTARSEFALLAGLFALSCVDVLPVLHAGELATTGKYTYAAIIITAVTISALRSCSVNVAPAYSVALAALAVWATATNAIGQMSGAERTSTTLFLPLLIFLIPATTPHFLSFVNFPLVLRLVTVSAAIYCALNVGLHAGSFLTNLTGPQHEKTYLMLLAFGIFAVQRRGIPALVSAFAIAFSLAARPSSTLVIGAIVTGLATLLVVNRKYRAMYIACATVAIASSLMPVVFLIEPDAVEPIFALEQLLKEDVLEGHSNSEFRWEIMLEARRLILDQNMLFGALFYGDATVMRPAALSWFMGEHPTIHSDFLIVLKLGGLVAYTVLCGGLFLAMRTSFKALVQSEQQRSPDAFQFYWVCVLMATLGYVYAAFNPTLYRLDTGFPIWFCLMIGLLGQRNLAHLSAEGVRLRQHPGLRGSTGPVRVSRANAHRASRNAVD